MNLQGCYVRAVLTSIDGDAPQQGVLSVLNLHPTVCVGFRHHMCSVVIATDYPISLN